MSQAAIQYADLADIVKMLNMEGGGSFMDIVNEAQKLVEPRGASPASSTPVGGPEGVQSE